VFEPSELQLHERLRTLLPSAQAETCRVVATFLDIRGFSTFAEKGESFDIASYLSSVYSTILSEHFPDADFFKPTGDGMLLIHELPAERTEVPHAVSSVLARCTSLVGTFGQIASEDFMINFPVPQHLGAGVARGTATRLVSGGLVLDYTGRCLNLAARLMDKARPYGVVFSDRFASDLMEAEVAASFSTDRATIRGIAEDEPIPIYVTDGVEITASDREPLTRTGRTWGAPYKLSVSEVRESSSHGFYLPRAPRGYERTMVHVEYPTFNGDGKPSEAVRSFDMPGTVEEHPHGMLIYAALKRVQDSLASMPATYETTFLSFTKTKTTFVTFTPFIEPVKDS
jgi:class 3 adenylate cyclase